MQSVHLVPVSLLLVRSYVPLLLQFFQVVVDVLLKLPHTLRRESMRHSLPLPRMLRTIPCVEQPPSDAHKRIVVLALQEAIAVAVDLRYGVCVRNANVMWLYAHELAVLCVRFVDCEVTFALATLYQEPEIRPCGRKGSRDIADLLVPDVG